jgi:hypothetical protein
MLDALRERELEIRGKVPSAEASTLREQPVAWRPKG